VISLKISVSKADQVGPKKIAIVAGALRIREQAKNLNYQRGFFIVPDNKGVSRFSMISSWRRAWATSRKKTDTATLSAVALCNPAAIFIYNKGIPNYVQ